MEKLSDASELFSRELESLSNSLAYGAGAAAVKFGTAVVSNVAPRVLAGADPFVARAATNISTEATIARGQQTAAFLNETQGVRLPVTLARAKFTDEQVAAIVQRYEGTNFRIATGDFPATIGDKIPYKYALSQDYLRIAYWCPVPRSWISIPEGFSVDEFVSRQFGGPQVPANQHLFDRWLNSVLGQAEQRAAMPLAPGTSVRQFVLEWDR